uniref:Wu:fc23c09 n=1 Tax=Kryptolebias marmoratus TaxID=37003 RepID=A0A3Q3AL39_KRYMA
MENGTIYTKILTKTSQQRQVTKTSGKPRLTSATTPSTKPTKPTKTNNRRKNKKRRKGKKKTSPPTYFPYFKDDYCPSECACYGRVVQCSDKAVSHVPYGIPYNARYILLMNNHITSIQLDLLSEYESMEFLTLSNNWLTDGAIEGAFEGVPALKRLYLDRNLLQSVPVDLPHSLEELRLDNNRLRLMSEAAWTRCPGLLVLSLSNNIPLGQFCRGVFNGLSELVVLDLSSNRLTNRGLFEDSLLNAKHLESLNLEGNKLSTLKNLEHLGLARNKIFKVAPGAFKMLPILHQLDLCHNTLQQVPRQLPQGLHSVALTHNKIKAVPRDAFCWGNKSLSGLVRVQLEHNLINMGKLDSQAFRCLRGFQVVSFY